MQSLQDFGFLSILPPIITILLAITTRNIIVSLSIGTFSGSLILTGFQPFQAILQLVEGQIFTQISRPSNTQVLITLACIGGFVKLIESSKSIEAFANIYRNVATCLQHKLANEDPPKEALDFPDIYDGLRGMLFVDKAVESSEAKSWIAL